MFVYFSNLLKNYSGVFLLQERNFRYSLVDYIADRHHKRYSDNATLRFALLHNALCLWRIVIASDSYRLDFSQALSLLIVIALSLQVSVIASLSYRFEQHYRF